MEIKSFWANGYQEFPALEADLDVDTLIVGGGLAGISAAYYLGKRGVKTVVIEAKHLGYGTSGNTTAHISSQHDFTYDRYISYFGQIKAAIIAKANEEAIKEIFKICDEEAIKCELVKTDSYLFTKHPENCYKLKKEFSAVKNTPIKAYLTSQTGLVPFEYELALVYENQAMFHPMQYLHGLADACGRNRVRIYENTRAIDFKDNRVLTDKGHHITAQNIIIATHFPVINFPGLYFARMYQHRSYNIACKTEQIVNGMWNCIDEDGYTYRMSQDKLIISGQNHRCGSETDIPHYKYIEEHAKVVFKAEIVAKWSAQDCMTADNLPFAGYYSKKDNHLFVMSGFNKWGMTSTNIAGKIIADLITEEKNPYSDIYSPGRKMPAAIIGKTIINNTVTAGSLIGGIGRIKNPVCPHMKCKTVFNHDEQTWDCPCHGSRYDKYGDIIDTPTVKKLDEETIEQKE